MRYFGQIDSEGWLGSVFAVAGEHDEGPTGCVLLPEWEKRSPPPEPWVRMRRVGEALVWQDPRTVEQQASEARSRRDTLLALTDWMVLRDLEGEGKIAPEWKAYRRALRDISEQAGWPHTIAWPTSP